MRDILQNELVQHQKNIRVYGYTIISGVMPADKVRALKSRVDDLFNVETHQQFAGRPERELTDKMVYNLQNKDKQFIDLLNASFIVTLLKDGLNDPFYRQLPPEEPNYILSYFNARSSGSQLDLHTDTFVPSPGEKTWTMQVAFILEDSEPSNGCTTFVPGSHISGRFVDRDLKDIKYLTAKAGDIVVWDSRAWHGTTANSSGKSRWSLIATLTCWWVKQRSDMTRSVPDSIYQALSDRQKCLLGFCSIPPKDEHDKLNFKGSYKDLRASVKDYY